MKKSRLLGAVCACLAIVSFNASAEIIDNDWYTTVNGLDWMDLSLTDGMSVSEALTQYDDWSLANEIQFSNMFAEYYTVNPDTLLGVNSAYIDWGVTDSYLYSLKEYRSYYNNTFQSHFGFTEVTNSNSTYFYYSFGIYSEEGNLRTGGIRSSNNYYGNLPSSVYLYYNDDSDQSAIYDNGTETTGIFLVRNAEVPVPEYSCVGDTFEAPFNEILMLKNKVKKAIPVKMSVVDTDGNLITESDISAPPVVDVSYAPDAGVYDGNNSDLVPPGLADDGNEFRFDYPYWVINLATKQFSSAGTYEVTAMAGDDSYSINASSCSGTFIRLP